MANTATIRPYGHLFIHMCLSLFAAHVIFPTFSMFCDTETSLATLMGAHETFGTSPLSHNLRCPPALRLTLATS